MAEYRPIVTERHVPSALTDRQFQDIIDSEVRKERERIIGILRTNEPPRYPSASWSWDQWRKNLVQAIGA